MLTLIQRKHRLLQKKVSAVAASADGCWALAADKFGDVYVAPLQPDQPAHMTGAAGSTDCKAQLAAPLDTPISEGQQTGGRVSNGKLPPAPSQAVSVSGGKAAVLLSHYNATITSLAVSADGGSLVSTDRDGKARVSVFPGSPMQVNRRALPWLSPQMDAV